MSTCEGLFPDYSKYSVATLDSAVLGYEKKNNVRD